MFLGYSCQTNQRSLLEVPFQGSWFSSCIFMKSNSTTSFLFTVFLVVRFTMIDQQLVLFFLLALAASLFSYFIYCCLYLKVQHEPWLVRLPSFQVKMKQTKTNNHTHALLMSSLVIPNMNLLSSSEWCACCDGFLWILIRFCNCLTFSQLQPLLFEISMEFGQESC